MSGAIPIGPELPAPPTAGQLRQRAFSTDDVAFMLGLDGNDKQVRELIRRGELASFRVGRHIRVADLEFERYLKASVRHDDVA